RRCSALQGDHLLATAAAWNHRLFLSTREEAYLNPGPDYDAFHICIEDRDVRSHIGIIAGQINLAVVQFSNTPDDLFAVDKHQHYLASPEATGVNGEHQLPFAESRVHTLIRNASKEYHI